MREKLKSIDYFTKKIESYQNSIQKIINWNLSGKTPKDRIHIMNKNIGGKKLRMIIAQYSAGYELNVIKNNYLELIKDFEKYWPPNIVMFNLNGRLLNQYLDYDDMLIMLSLGYLFQIPNTGFDILPKLIDRDEVKDFLYEFLVKRKTTRRQEIILESYESNHKLYLPIKKAIKSKDKKVASNLLLKHLTEDWPKEHHNLLQMHKNIYHENYYGYWSFESAAIVCAMDLDDSSFRDNEYYPQDLVDYFRDSK